jgi:hypothetical protein
VDADETAAVLEALLNEGNDVLRYLWMSCADPMACPLKSWPRVEIAQENKGEPIVEILPLMIETRRW